MQWSNAPPLSPSLPPPPPTKFCFSTSRQLELIETNINIVFSSSHKRFINKFQPKTILKGTEIG